jgi:hypothetical protein
MSAADGAPPPRRRAVHRILALVLALAAALVAGDVVLWRWAEGQLEARFADWTAAARAHGWAILAAPPVRSGWPLAAQITMADLTVSAHHPELPGDLDWSAARLGLRMALLHPRTLDITVAGMQHLRIGALADLPFTADRFEAVVPLQPGVPAHGGDLKVAQLRVGIDNAGLTLARARLHGEWKPAALQGEAVLTLSADVADLVLPGGTWAFGPRIGSAAFDLMLTGPLPPAETPLARATAWRDGGGTLELQRLALDWGPLNLNGSATLALDEHMQPMGAATARIVGYAATLDALAAARVIGTRAAMTAKAVLGLMAHAPADSAAPEVEVPLTLQDGTLSVGRIPLARMPEFSWPDAP